MNPGATALLTAWGVPVPRSYPVALPFLMQAPRGDYFLRGPSGSAFRGIRSAGWLRTNADALVKAFRRSELLAIEELLQPQLSASVFTGEQMFAELVSGPPSRLLIDAEWSMRYIAAQQDAMVGRIATPSTLEPAEYSALQQFAEDVEDILRNRVPSGFLLEAALTESGRIVVVDARPWPRNTDFQMLFNGTGTDLLRFSRGTSVYSGDFDLARLAEIEPGTEIHLANRALSCHFVTYALARGCAAICV